MIYDLLGVFQIDLFKRPKRLGDLSFAVDLDQCLPLARSGFRCRKNLQVKWIVPCHSIIQLTKHFMQNWSLGFSEDAVPKLAVVFKVVLGIVGTSYSLCQIITSVKISRGEVAVRRFESQRDKGQPQFRDIQDLFRRERLYDRTFKRAYNDCAFLLERKQRLADRRPADFEFLNQFGLR